MVRLNRREMFPPPLQPPPASMLFKLNFLGLATISSIQEHRLTPQTCSGEFLGHKHAWLQAGRHQSRTSMSVFLVLYYNVYGRPKRPASLWFIIGLLNRSKYFLGRIFPDFQTTVGLCYFTWSLNSMAMETLWRLQAFKCLDDSRPMLQSTNLRLCKFLKLCCFRRYSENSIINTFYTLRVH